VVSVLVTGPKGHGFKPSRSDTFLMAIKILSTPSLEWEVKLEALCCKILWHVKDMLTSQTLIGKILMPSSIPPTCSQMSLLVGFPESSGG
jgi:hypothetical protein